MAPVPAAAPGDRISPGFAAAPAADVTAAALAAYRTGNGLQLVVEAWPTCGLLSPDLTVSLAGRLVVILRRLGLVLHGEVEREGHSGRGRNHARSTDLGGNRE